MLRTINIDLVYQPLIEHLPQNDTYQKACAADQTTIQHWKDIWVQNTQKTKDHFGSFAEKSIGKLFGTNKNKPAIICGSGPSLKHSIEALKENKRLDEPLTVVSALHNFGYFEDEGCHADYYITLDAGDIILKDVYEGRKEIPEYYWEKTKDKTLIAAVTTPVELFKKWQGNVYLFNILVPHPEIQMKMQSIERFAHYISSGGNASGGCLYFSKAILGSDPIHFVGVDCCFDYDNTFHSYKTAYDQVGQYVVHPDLFGIPRKTWGSYLGFKYFFDWFSMNIPGNYVMCSEGIVGAYPQGNLKSFKYMSLMDALKPYQIAQRVFLEQKDALGNLLNREEIKLKELFSKPDYDRDIVVY